MAASAAEKDYVHLVTAHIAKAAGAPPQTMVKNIADFERSHTTYDIKKELAAELNFNPQIIIVAIGENVATLSTDGAQAAYAKAFAELLAALQATGQPSVVSHTDGVLSRAARARATFARMVSALAVHTKGFEW
jgi:hypothetical protein